MAMYAKLVDGQIIYPIRRNYIDDNGVSWSWASDETLSSDGWLPVVYDELQDTEWTESEFDGYGIVDGEIHRQIKIKDRDNPDYVREKAKAYIKSELERLASEHDWDSWQNCLACKGSEVFGNDGTALQAYYDDLWTWYYKWESVTLDDETLKDYWDRMTEDRPEWNNWEV